MADSCCLAELKETIEEMNAELIQSHTKISKVTEQEECPSAAQKEMRKLQEENAQLSRDLKEVNEANDDALDINSLPNEIILKIFSYLTQSQLGYIARVCRRWNVLTKCPVLWRKVNVKIFSFYREHNTVAESFINGLPSCVTFIRLNFLGCRFVGSRFSEWEDLIAVKFEELCVKLHQNCPHLEELILSHLRMSHLRISHLTEDSFRLRFIIEDLFTEVINFCTQFLQCVKKLVFYYCSFPNYSRTVELNDNSKIEVLDLYHCYISHFGCKQFPFSKLLSLKELRLSCTNISDNCFVDDNSFLNQLHVLDLGWTWITARTFLAIQNHGHNLKELYLCNLKPRDHDLNLEKSAFPHLKTICLSESYVTCEDIVSLIQSCPSLQNVYVDGDVGLSFAAHPFVVANRCKSGIVKAIDWDHLHNVDYSQN